MTRDQITDTATAAIKSVDALADVARTAARTRPLLVVIAGRLGVKVTDADDIADIASRIDTALAAKSRA